MTTIKLSGGSLGSETMLVRCNLSQASSPVEVDYQNDAERGWESTQYQCADASHRTSGLIRIAKSLAAAAVEVREDELSCDSEDVSGLCEIAQMLNGHGPQFTGNNVDDEAQGWLDEGFDAESAGEWCEIGCWDASTAARLRDAGLSAKDADTAADALIEVEKEKWEKEDAYAMEHDLELPDHDSEYTDGSPIYSACNNDTPVSKIIEAAE